MLAVNVTIAENLVKLLRDGVLETGLNKAVIGLSGGADSAAVAYLAVKALGKDNVTLVAMPYKDSSPESLMDAKIVADDLGMTFQTVEITPMVTPYLAGDTLTPLRLGNLLARVRMAVLFDYSAKVNGLVLGTGNKSELALGYYTLFGDSAYAINPIGDMYKTQVWQLLALFGANKKIITKKPSADHFYGQTDESDIGYSYEELDRLLYFLIEGEHTVADAYQERFDKVFVDSIVKRVNMNIFKRKLPTLLSIGQRPLTGNNATKLI